MFKQSAWSNAQCLLFTAGDPWRYCWSSKGEVRYKQHLDINNQCQGVFFQWRCKTKGGPRPPRLHVSRSHTIRHTHAHTQTQTRSVGLICNEWSVLWSDCYCTTHNKHNRRTSMPSVRYEPTSPAIKRTQTYVLDPTATGIGQYK
jgi:hypothetical protein